MSLTTMDLTALDSAAARTSVGGATGVQGGPRLLLRVEGALVLGAALLAYAHLGGTWGWFALLFLLPDLSLLGYLAGADSIVTSHEAEFANGLMDQLDLPARGRDLAQGAFLRGRQRKIEVDAELKRFLAEFPAGSTEAGRLYDALVQLAAADGRVRPTERIFLEQVTRGLGFHVEELNRRLAAASR